MPVRQCNAVGPENVSRVAETTVRNLAPELAPDLLSRIIVKTQDVSETAFAQPEHTLTQVVVGTRSLVRVKLHAHTQILRAQEAATAYRAARNQHSSQPNGIQTAGSQGRG